MKTKLILNIGIVMFMVCVLSTMISAADAINLGSTNIKENTNTDTIVQTNDIDMSVLTPEERSLITAVDYLRSTGGVPLKIETVTTTNWNQLIISLLVSSVFLIFFFGQMVSGSIDNTAVKIALKTIKKKTGRNVVFIKHTSAGMFSQSMIDQSTAIKLATAMAKFKGADFDLILHTPGGEVFSALMISRMLKDYPGKIRTIVPAFAMSGGTLLALSTDEIIMNSTACLGPVDPQLGSLFKSGSARSWNQIVKFKGKKAEDSSISMAMTGSQYTRSIRDHLEDTMDFGLSTNQKKKISDYLTSGNIEHAYALTPSRLTDLGIPVKIMKNTKVIENLMKIISKLAGEGLTFI